MSKRTVALLLPSPAALGPWGDLGWLPAGQVHYVVDGPDFLWAGAARIGEDPSHPSSVFDGMVVRDSAAQCAADIAVMAFGMLDVPGWRALEAWWDDVDCRERLLPVLRALCEDNRGRYKIGVVRFTDSVKEADRLAQIADELDRFGIRLSFFDEAL